MIKGGAQGLLLNQLGVSEGCNVVFDSAHYQLSEIDTDAVEHYDEKQFESLFDPNWQSFEICPTFVDFSFSNWELNDPITQIPLHEKNNNNNNNNNQDLIDDDNYDMENDFDHFDGIQIEPVYQDLVTNIITGENEKNNFGDFDIGKVIAGETSEYSYFNKQLVDSWKGPDHWKFNAKSLFQFNLFDNNYY